MSGCNCEVGLTTKLRHVNSTTKKIKKKHNLMKGKKQKVKTIKHEQKTHKEDQKEVKHV